MILISHRGNTTGKTLEENNPSLLNKLIEKEYNVEIDVWYDGEQLFLGHDKPEFKVETEYLKNDLFWCHAKNLLALEFMLENNIHCFWHQNDDYTLTSKGIIWTYPNRLVSKKSVIVCKTLQETEYYKDLDIFGICSDYIGETK
tara:strand:+ start:6622 stop:7053 length:432 start_codon:yes stop_codon:yes gene_type:complete